MGEEKSHGRKDGVVSSNGLRARETFGSQQMGVASGQSNFEPSVNPVNVAVLARTGFGNVAVMTLL